MQNTIGTMSEAHNIQRSQKKSINLRHRRQHCSTNLKRARLTRRNATIRQERACTWGRDPKLKLHANLQKVAAKPQRSATALCNHANKHLGERERSGLGRNRWRWRWRWGNEAVKRRRRATRIPGRRYVVYTWVGARRLWWWLRLRESAATARS